MKIYEKSGFLNGFCNKMEYETIWAGFAKCSMDMIKNLIERNG